MSNNQQPMIVVPPWWNQQPPAPQPEPVAEVPSRVHVAMSLLRHFTEKTASHFAKDNDAVGGGLVELGGQKLDVEELKALRDACNVMSSYVTGVLKPCGWDGKAGKRKKGGKAVSHDGKPIGIKNICPHCNGDRLAKMVCGMCDGKGAVLMVKLED